MVLEHGFCPKCGRELSIPDGLEEFSCLYCGERMTLSQLLKEAAAPTDSAQDYRAFQRDALHAAVDYPQSMEHLSKPLFFDYFEKYYADCSAPFEALERCACVPGADRDALAGRAAGWLMERVEAWFRDQKGWKLRASRNNLRDRTKITVAIFLIPTACRCAPVIGRAFSEALREEWTARFPESTFELTTYEELTAGFKKNPLCFVTTAVCEFLGEPNDGPMLTDFRSFRDGYLRQQPGGEAEIREYYDVAPGIVMRIDCCEDRTRIYPELYRRYLKPCREALKAGDNARCHAVYRQMMGALISRYGG